MKLLALDTSSLACSVGAVSGNNVVTRYDERPREHTKILLPMIRDVLEQARLSLTDLDAIVLGNGPGSFIGVRIAASVAQGLAFGAGLEIVPVSSMTAVALAAGGPGDSVAVTQDAHMQQVYLGIYTLDDAGHAKEVVAERLHAQQEIAELGALDGVIPAGEGWRRYPALLEANAARLGALSDSLYPTAEALLTLGAAAFESGESVRPELIDPVYLREKVAELPQTAKP